MDGYCRESISFILKYIFNLSNEMKPGPDAMNVSGLLNTKKLGNSIN